MSETKIPVELRQAISENKLIIFVGAGLSYDLKNRKGQTIGGWGNLVKEIIAQLQAKGHHIEFLLPLLNVYEPIEVLHLIEKHPDFSKEAIYDIATEFLELDDSQNDYTLHQKLNKLSKKIITTNYDIAFERAVPSLHRNKAYKGRNYKLNKHRNSDAELLFKLHGCLDHLDNMILFPTDYKQFYTPPKRAENEKYALDVFKNIINNNSVLFIGAGMGDFQINNIFRNIKRIQKEYGKKHFIITNKPLDSSLGFLTPIEKKHTEISEFIDELLEIKKESQFKKNEEVILLQKELKKADDRIKELESQTNRFSKENLLEREALKYFKKGLKHQLAGRFDKAIKKYTTSSELSPNIPRINNNWGVCIARKARSSNSKEAEGLYHISFQKFSKATESDKNYAVAYYNWGSALTRLALLKNDESAIPLLEDAIKKHQKATELKKDYYKAYGNWANALILLARKKQENEDELYEEALEKLKKSIEQGGNHYNLSCLYALRNQKEEAFYYLEITLENQDQTIDFILEDPDWKDYLEDPDFLAIIEKYKSPSS